MQIASYTAWLERKLERSEIWLAGAALALTACAAGWMFVRNPIHNGPEIDFGFLLTIGCLLCSIACLVVAGYFAGRQVGMQSDLTVFDPSNITPDALQDAAAILSREAVRIASLVEASADNHKSYADQLQGLEGRIVTVRTADQLRTIAGLLAIENQRIRASTKQMATQLETSRAQIHHLRTSLAEARDDSLRDPLTGIGNRRAFDSSLVEAVRDTVRKAAPLSLVLADIDGFKKINDDYGHLAGDMVLQHFARILTDRSRPGEIVARFGGEEFAIVLPGLDNLAASVLSERLRTRIEQEPFVIDDGREIKITASLGVAQLRTGEGADDLARRADDRLYRAKSLGRNRVVTT